jgi:hypothetical protein
MSVNTIVLLTDFGLNDNFVGVMKGVILSINHKAKLVDVTHSIGSCNIKDAAFILLKSFSYFPKGTIFLAVVDPGVGSARKPIAIKTKNYYFVGPDNGILSMAAKSDGIEKMVALENKRYFLKNISFTFHGRDIFAPVAGYISKNVPFTSLGKDIEKIEEIEWAPPKIKENILEAEIIYIDKFGNLITNIDKAFFKRFLKGKKFIAHLQGKEIRRMYSLYTQAKEGEPFFIEDSFSLIEISIKNHNAKDYFFPKDIKKNKLIVKKVS